MKFSHWIAERNQRDATKYPERKTNLELHIRASRKSAHEMKCGRAGPMASDGRPKRKNRGQGNREEIRKSESGD